MCLSETPMVGPINSSGEELLSYEHCLASATSGLARISSFQRESNSGTEGVSTLKALERVCMTDGSSNHLPTRFYIAFSKRFQN